MPNEKTISRRTALAAGLSAAVSPAPALAAPKAKGETKVIYYGGDYVHNGVAQEPGIRETFSATGWRIFFAQASRFITPAELADTDLLILTRTGVADVLGYSTSGLVKKRPRTVPVPPACGRGGGHRQHPHPRHGIPRAPLRRRESRAPAAHGTPRRPPHEVRRAHPAGRLPRFQSLPPDLPRTFRLPRRPR